MVGVSCLVRNTALVQDLKDLVQYVAYDAVGRGTDASLRSVYNTIRESGIEIDLQSLGYIYNDSLPKSYQNFDSDNEVNDYILKSYNDAIERAALLEDKDTDKKIGEDKPEIYLVNGLLNMFTNANIEDKETQSDMLRMQNALWSGIQRKLNLPENQKPKNSTEWKDILNKALGYESLGIRDLSGKLNSISDLYDGMRKQLIDANRQMKNSADPATLQRWNEMINGLEATTYSLLFSRGEAKELLNGIMKEAGFGKTLKSGETIIDWNKLAGGIGSVQDVRSNVEKVLTDNGFNQSVIDGVKKSLENEFNDLHAQILEKSAQSLASQEGRLGAETNQKSDLRRLAELNNLGIFDSAHDRLLNSIIGVPDIQQQDIDDLKLLADAASELFREIDKNYGNEIFASRHLQTIQRSIDKIISRNIGNKTTLMKIVNAIKSFFDVLLTGLLMRPFTILENLYSGIKEVLVPTIMGRGLKKEDLKIYRKMLSDVSIRGQAFGEEVGNFSPQELYTNTLKWKWDWKNWSGKGIKEKSESLIFALMLPGRIGLLGFDSANKVTLTNKVFNNSIYQALTQKGMKKDEAIKFMNEALYGESFKDAEKRAKELIEKINTNLPDRLKVPVNSRTITTFANDLVKHNLNANGALNNDVIEAANKSAYHVAGYGLGHEANNTLSTAIKGYRNRRKQEGDRLAKSKEWNKLALHRLKDTFVNGMVLRFTGGATNWMYLRAQSGLGVGLFTGFLGNWNGDIDFKDKASIEQSMKDIQNRRNMISRSIIGIGATALAYTIGYALTRSMGDDDEKKKLQELYDQQSEIEKTKGAISEKGKSWPVSSKGKTKAQTLNEIAEEIKSAQANVDPFQAIKQNWMQSRLFKKTAPDIMLLHYYVDTDKSNYAAALDYVQQTTGLGSSFSTSAKVASASTLVYRGDYDGANGQLASIAGERFAVPTWQAYKDWGKLFQWVTGGTPTSDYKKPTDFSEGLWGGGALEDLGFYKRNPTITNLPGIGGAAYEKFKAQGITKFDDLKANEEWYNMKDESGKFILDKDDREKAKKGYEKYTKQK